MTRSNRILNRLWIALVGLVAIATGVVLAAPRFIGKGNLDIATPTTETLWIALAACVVIIVLALVWILSRGRGRASEVIELKDDAGSITIDARVAADLIADALHDNRDIVSVGSGSYRMRGSRVLSLRVVARKGANLPALIGAVGGAVDELDVVLERRIPVLLQVVSGLSVREIRTR
jgi:hypothetical protein